MFEARVRVEPSARQGRDRNRVDKLRRKLRLVQVEPDSYNAGFQNISGGAVLDEYPADFVASDINVVRPLDPCADAQFSEKVHDSGGGRRAQQHLA